MKMKLRVGQLSFVFLMTLLVLSINCSSNMSLTTPEINRALPENTPENCEKFAGEWYSNTFNNIEDEDKSICGNKPCKDGRKGGSGFRLICTNGEISGEVILAWSTPFVFANRSTTQAEADKPIIVQPIVEDKTSFKDIRIENGVLHLSYSYGTDKDCLEAISVSPKDKFLLGKYQNQGCRKPFAYPEKGSILFERK